MAKPKLALIPATQGSKLYSVLPADGVGDFSFNRSGSATRINKDGLIETVASGVSRLNYPLIDGKVVGCPSHLLEPESRNLVTYSEDFSQWWVLKNTTQSSNQVISPDGTLNAYKITEDNSNSGHRINTAGSFINTSVTTNKVFSVFVKKNEVTRIGIVDYRYLNGLEVEFNLETKSIDRNYGNLYVSSKIEEYPNDWLRCTVVYDTEAFTSMAIVLLDDNYNSSTKIRDYTYQGDGTSGIYVWGAELKVGNPTSYIPTSSTSVTRSAETANGAGDASTFNDSEGVLMAEISALSDDGTIRTFSLSSGSSANSVRFYFGANNTINYNVKVGGANQFTETYTLNNQQDFNKFVFKYKSNDFALWVNGFEVGIISSGNTPIGLSEIAFDSGDGSSDIYSSAKQIQYFDSALNDSDLETLTSWTSFTDMANGQLYTIE